ncbi:hypothetical protein DL764_008798 [Monosporascus ibericus]|uniref:Uncharacterized protein n=1 Tax=Monosporascus ibericus TaxID=155417 RepID=A0A4Q4SYU4_9PEZI|nr:hypothetical protein DL764_008798 [Monosporascus ibericus]
MAAYPNTHGQQQPTENAPRPQLPEHLEALSRALVRGDTLQEIAANYGIVLRQWVALVKETTLPTNLSSSDPQVTGAFQKIVDATGSESTVFRRLAHVRLLEFFDYLEVLIQLERAQGLHGQKVRNITIADRVISSALPALGKDKLIEVRRFARRWKQLAGPSVFFLMIYTEAAEGIV